jgi:hypothetical protein
MPSAGKQRQESRCWTSYCFILAVLVLFITCDHFIFFEHYSIDLLGELKGNPSLMVELNVTSRLTKEESIANYVVLLRLSAILPGTWIMPIWCLWLLGTGVFWVFGL